MKTQPRKIIVNSERWVEKPTTCFEKTFLLFVTDVCNLRCEYCFNKGNLKDNKTSSLGIMDLDYIEKLVVANTTVEKYDIMGGEPLLHPDFDKIVEILEKYDKKIGLYTNGYLLDSRLKEGFSNLKVNISFQSINHENRMYKPIAEFSDGIKKIQSKYPVKLVLLLNNENKSKVFEIVKYIEDQFEHIDKITIGAVRNEEDYWNDNFDYVVPFQEYGDIMQKFIDNYDGRLDVDIFTKGYLFTDNLSQNTEDQIGRFKCIFPKEKYVPSLYEIAKDEMIDFNVDKPIEFGGLGNFQTNGREWTDKICLKRKR